MRDCCTTERHAALKLDPVAWAGLEFKGVQRFEADGDEPAEALEMRNCTLCHSTLCKEIAP